MNNPQAPDTAGTTTQAAGDGRSARWDAHRAARRLELIKLARHTIHRLGPGASMEEIAAQANTSKSVFYRYFGDKEGLRQALGQYVITNFRTEVISAALKSSGEGDALHAMVLAYLQMAATSPNIYFFVTASPATDVLTDPAGAGGQVRDGALNDFFEDLATMMRERMHAYMGVGPGEQASPALELWPRASIGMVRAAGELWLRAPEGPGRPGIEELARSLTLWLTHGVASQATLERP
ncbi:TetR/AcrR family transcriptional regulator [Paeniglutamicibacter psychrophenolicus]|uniref:AcrR family transcriptional regulator n=1 Tax=Paeniglutamicibacter psychrophenolicus TaxID=257454 RepID=A0ABS4WET0_9MICC|nr:AcrR family transcriptional regulator [Paeniglutamicibacter psychrophenolicus]